MQLRSLFWHIDRWRKSSASMRMTLEEQGAYRNLLDEAWLRGGALPTDDRYLAKACGDVTRWRVVREAVMARFVQREDGWHNETLDTVLHESVRRAQKQAAYRARQHGNGHGNAAGNAVGNARRGNVTTSPSPSPSMYKEPPYSPPLEGGRRPTRAELQQARAIRKNRMRCDHDPPCPNHQACVRAIVGELRAKREA